MRNEVDKMDYFANKKNISDVIYSGPYTFNTTSTGYSHSITVSDPRVVSNSDVMKQNKQSDISLKNKGKTLNKKRS